MKNSIISARPAQGCTCSGEVRSRPARPFLVVRSWELKRRKRRWVAGDSNGGFLSHGANGGVAYDSWKAVTDDYKAPFNELGSKHLIAPVLGGGGA